MTGTISEERQAHVDRVECINAGNTVVLKSKKKTPTRKYLLT